ncbi:hypothetical protein G7074_24095 [Pedobacter sp. HDW13]|uniref:hypothetical protein n=1 Tax=unclassified Pedobacter TaxID=2628915 RepID=UPI000F594508|nr:MULTISPECIES: hypothetical protein [unclassified Pedobacter]QIL42076.1 hypothetical protein G7074_24095 [Pedobacter sp. HDW13]RQO76691.1 hypothetical protein DBR40_12445 [Pedobacter sp. KBW01]
MEGIENQISKDKNILLVLFERRELHLEISDLIDNFCGKVVNTVPEVQTTIGKRLYVCGDLSSIKLDKIQTYIIREFSSNYENLVNEDNIDVVELGEVPIVVNNAGVYFRNLFNDDYFNSIETEHKFQELTESTKESKSFRKGIYLTEILKEETIDNNEVLHFRLLRCSSNLTGPTDNFRETDRKIIDLLNDSVKFVFEKETKLNHVLAQIYENKRKENQKEIKSKISAHSDKTKDMPKDGLIAFCTFYDMSAMDNIKPSKTDKYDWCYKETSALTRLHFKLKKSVDDPALINEFSITLYPNSVFIIPLSTNRLYTHEIKPSILNIDQIPTRMGYVVRCSNLEAVYMNAQTYIKENNNLFQLEDMTSEMLEDLRNSYYRENTTKSIIDYGRIHFSMNSGDYERPIY